MTVYRSEHLADSGEDTLDTWLRRAARQAEAANTGRTFVWSEPGSPAVVGYFTLAAHLIRRSDVPRSVGHGSPEAIPAILLARLALHRSLQGRGLGGQLLLDALERAVDASAREPPGSSSWTPSATRRPPSTSATGFAPAPTPDASSARPATWQPLCAGVDRCRATRASTSVDRPAGPYPGGS